MLNVNTPASKEKKKWLSLVPAGNLETGKGARGLREGQMPSVCGERKDETIHC